ncbi:MAG: hypothetical protein WC708_12495 [Lentisphaeria bacterium]
MQLKLAISLGVAVLAQLAHGQDGQVSIANAVVRLTASAAGGRVVWFGFADGANVLQGPPSGAEQRGTGWARVYPTLDSLGAAMGGSVCEPESPFQGTWHLEKISAGELKMTSPACARTGVRMVRRVRLCPGEPAVQLLTRVEAVGDPTWPCCVWSVAGLPVPEAILLDALPLRHQPGGSRVVDWWMAKPECQGITLDARPLDERTVVFAPKGARLGKLGTQGGWIAAVYDWGVFVMSAPYDPAGSYADGAALEAFACPAYVEIETVGPLAVLKRGASIEVMEEWRLLRGAKLTPAAAANLIRQELKQN